MDIDVFPRSLLERAWQADRARFSPAAEDPPLCLRCGRPLAARLSENLPSCRAAVYICRACGREERRRGGFWDPAPLTRRRRRRMPPSSGPLSGADGPAGAAEPGDHGHFLPSAGPPRRNPGGL